MVTDRKPLECWLPDLCGPPITLLRLLLFGLLLSLLLVILRSGLSGFDWQLLGRTSLLVTWITVLSALGLCALRSSIARSSVILGVTTAFLWVLFVTLFSTLLLHWLMLSQLGIEDRSLLNEVLENVIVTSIVTGILLRYCFIDYELRVRDRAASQARFDALQARIEPHFLFNSMNTIITLISVDPKAAEQAALDLSDLFRAALRQGDEDSTVGEELELVKKYLAIEKLRMGDRLDWRIDVDSELLTSRLPGLTLQPIIENAVVHGLHPLHSGGLISLHIQKSGRGLLLNLSNPCPPGVPVSPSGKRMGLENIEARLEEFYGEPIRMQRGIEEISAKTDSAEVQYCYRLKLELPFNGSSDR